MTESDNSERALHIVLTERSYKDNLTPAEMSAYLAKFPHMAPAVVINCPEHRAQALSVDGMALKLCPKKEQSYELIEAALRQNGLALKHASKLILRRHPELYRIAVRSNGLALKQTPEEYRSEGIFEDAVKSNGEAISLVPPELVTHDLCLRAVRTTPSALRYVPRAFVNSAIASEAVSRNPMLIADVPRTVLTKDMCLIAVSGGQRVLEQIPSSFRDREVIDTAVDKNWQNVLDIYKPTKRLLMRAFAQSPHAIKVFPQKWITRELFTEAFERDPSTLIYAPFECSDADKLIRCLDAIWGRRSPEAAELRYEVRSFMGRIDQQLLRDAQNPWSCKVCPSQLGSGKEGFRHR